jgi:uncharacterized tellurite resistance protein B-like protein
MLDAIRRFFDQRIAMPAGESGAAAGSDEHRLQLATAALLLEVARADRVSEDLEMDAVELAIGRVFELSREEANELIDLAEVEVDESTSHFGFTSLVKDQFSPAQKVQLVEMLWRVAVADGNVDKYEENLVRRIADLIYVPHRDFIAAKLRVLDRSAAP